MTSRAPLCPTLLLLAAGLIGAAAPAAAGTSAKIRGEDALGRAGRAVTLRAKLEQEGLLGIDPDVEEEPLDFFLVERDGSELEEARFLGSGETDDDGFAETEWTPDEPGTYVVEARIRRGSDYVAFPAPILVAIPPPERAIILVQLDETVSKATNLQMWRGKENEEIAAVEGARQVLEALAASYQLVYLTDLDASFTTKFKGWLTLRDVPPAPVLFWDLFERSLSHETYMQMLVEKLVQDHPAIEAGVGGEESDAAAFCAHGLAGIVLTDADELDEEELPDAALTADAWEDLLVHVARLYRSKGLIRDVAGPDPEASAAALAELSLLGDQGLGYVHRFLSDPDPSRATAAALVAGRLEASAAFFRALDLSGPEAALHSLLAAWREGERAVVVRLYRDRKTGLNEPIPEFRRLELVSRHEPSPGKVVFRVRLLPDAGEPFERQVVLVEEDDVWKVEVEDF